MRLGPFFKKLQPFQKTLFALLFFIPVSSDMVPMDRPTRKIASIAPAQKFAIVGDTQRTLLVERVFLGREQNNSEREEIIQSIVAEQPAFLVHLGDMVDWGGNRRIWDLFDTLIKPVQDAGIPIFPVLGNHDYFGLNKRRALGNAYQRFPLLKQSHWYTKEYNGLGMIFLDSNRKKLAEEQWAAQVEFLKKALTDFDANQSIHGIILFNHHPAYTNSRVTGDEPCINESLLPLFKASKKTMAYITGHAHGYEHFLEGGKHFIISAGGGGPRVEYFTAEKSGHQDLYTGPAPRPFNYLVVQPGATGIAIEVKGFEKGETHANLRVIDTISIAYP